MTERAQLKQLVTMPAREPPKEIRIFKTGKVETTKGTFLFDDKAGKSVMTAWESYGNDLMLDYEHMSVNPDGRAGDGKAAGWFKLELRPDGLYAVDIKWTQQAADQIAAAEWRYFSPTFDFDKKSGRILELVNVALTNIPATKNLPALVAASKADSMAKRAKDSTKMTAKTAEELAKAKLASKAKAKAKPAAKSLGFKKTKKTMETTEEETADEVEAADDDASTDDADLEEADDAELEEADDADLEESDDADLADGDDDTAAAGFGDDDDDDDDDDAESDDDDSTGDAAKKAKKTSRVSERAALATLREITGKDDLSEAVGVMRAFRISQDKVETLSKQVDELRKSNRRAAVRSMIENACKAGKLLPAQREAFTKIGMRDVKELKGLLDTMPKRVRMEEDSAKESLVAGSSGLTETERSIARKANSEDLYTKAKADGKLLSLDAFLSDGEN